MCRHADATSAPSVFAVSLLFGGGSGALIAASFGLHGGVGFLSGATLAFALISGFVLKRQYAQSRAQKPPSGMAQARTSQPTASAEPA